MEPFCGKLRRGGEMLQGAAAADPKMRAARTRAFGRALQHLDQHSPGADDECAGLLQTLLPVASDLREKNVTRIAGDLIVLEVNHLRQPLGRHGDRKDELAQVDP